MSELRRDPITGRWIITRTMTGIDTPSEFFHPRKMFEGIECPFCKGNENLTEPEIFAFRKEGSKPDDRNWAIRVFRDKYPILHTDSGIKKKGVGDAFLYDMINGFGVHEIIVETSKHITNFAELDIDQMKMVLMTYRIRLNKLRGDKRLKYGLVYRNQGYDPVVSLPHSHSQIIALPVVPKSVKEELVTSRNYFREKQRCLFCDIIKEERGYAARIVDEGDNFIAVIPYAPRFAFETHIYPLKHQSDFTKFPDSDLDELSKMIKNIFYKITKLLNNPPINLVLHTSPFKIPEEDYWDTIVQDYHWHIEIMPHAVPERGFEFGADFFITPPSPEISAKFLREVS